MAISDGSFIPKQGGPWSDPKNSWEYRGAGSDSAPGNQEKVGWRKAHDVLAEIGKRAVTGALTVAAITALAAIALGVYELRHAGDFDMLGFGSDSDAPPTKGGVTPDQQKLEQPAAQPRSAPNASENRPNTAPEGTSTAANRPVVAATQPAPAPTAEQKASFVSESTYETANLNLGGVDLDGDGTRDGMATPVSIDNPSNEDISDFRNAAAGHRDDIALTSGEARDALQAGGFVKDGKTYEIWSDIDDPTKFHITQVHADHRLVGEVPDLDEPRPEITDPYESDDYDPEEAPAPDDAYDDRVDIPPAEVERFLYDLDYTFGKPDDCGNIIPGSGYDGFINTWERLGRPSREELEWGTPPPPDTDAYDDWNKLRDFVNRHPRP